MREKLVKIIESSITAYIVISIIGLIRISPIILIALNSFKTTQEALAWPPTLFPKTLTLDAYIEVIQSPSPIPIALRNSCIIAGGTTFCVLALGVFTAYGLSKYRFRGSGQILLFHLITRIIPPISLIVPFYIILSSLNLTNTFTGLIIILTYLAYPLVVMIIKSFFDALPRDLVDAALIDGCTRTGAFLRVVLPLSAVGIAAAGIITFLWTWNEFLYALVFTSTTDVKPVTVTIFHFVGEELIDWNLLSAVAIVTSLPAIIFFIFAQKYIVTGLTKGGLKF